MAPHMPPVPQLTPEDIKSFVLAAADGDETTLRAMLAKYGAAIINAQDDVIPPSHGSLLSGGALLQASYYAHKEIAALLLKNGADIEMQNKYGWTPLMLSAREGHTEIVRLLLENGAETGTIHRETNRTALNYAEKEHPDTAELLRQWPVKELLEEQARKKQEEQVRTEALLEERIQKLKQKRPPIPALKKPRPQP